MEFDGNGGPNATPADTKQADAVKSLRKPIDRKPFMTSLNQGLYENIYS